MGSHKKKSHKKEKEHKRLKKEKKRKKSKKKRRHSSSSSCSPPPVKKSRQESMASTDPNSSHREQEEEETYEVPLPPSFSTSGNAEPQKIKLPLTREQYEAKSKEIKRVFDPQTGRHRLIRGEGEVIEEVVTRDRHKQINKQATRGDGDAFQRTLNASLKR